MLSSQEGAGLALLRMEHLIGKGLLQPTPLLTEDGTQVVTRVPLWYTPGTNLYDVS